MTDLPAFLLACLALLAAPGPTNAMVAAAAAQRGLRRSLVLVFAVLAAYAIAVSLWSVLVNLAATSLPWVPIVAKLLAALFLLRSAYKLWRTANAGAPTGITTTQIAAVTLLNPKALVFAFALFPPFGWPEIMPFAAGFCVLVLLCTAGWIVLGAGAAKSNRWFDTRRINQITAVVLVVFAALLVAQLALGPH